MNERIEITEELVKKIDSLAADDILLKFVGCVERALISLNVEGMKWLEFLSE